MLESNKNGARRVQDQSEVRWCPSLEGFLKIKTDSSVKSGHDFIGIGAVIRDA